VYFWLSVNANSYENKIKNVEDDGVTVDISAQPIKGKANKEIIKYFS